MASLAAYASAHAYYKTHLTVKLCPCTQGNKAAKTHAKSFHPFRLPCVDLASSVHKPCIWYTLAVARTLLDPYLEPVTQTHLRCAIDDASISARTGCQARQRLCPRRYLTPGATSGE